MQYNNKYVLTTSCHIAQNNARQKSEKSVIIFRGAAAVLVLLMAKIKDFF